MHTHKATTIDIKRVWIIFSSTTLAIFFIGVFL